MWIYNDVVSEPKAVRAVVDARVCLFCRAKMSVIKEEPSVSPRGMDEIMLTVQFCAMCGWWTKKRTVIVYFKDTINTNCYADGVVGSLREFDISDQSSTIEEIRSYLAVKYDERFHIDPWKFEEVVSSVYKHLGYDTRVTARSGDGGIDVVLDGPGNTLVGVQVKRYRNKIKVEQIRSFAGALLLNGMTRGVFVTTSRFQSGANEVARLYKLKGIAIELIDAEKFYQALGIAQRAAYKDVNDPSAPFHSSQLISIGFYY